MSSENIHILLVEDEDPHAELIKRAFEDYEDEFRLHRVRSLSEARIWINQNQPRLIIADWRLPDGESLELLPNHLDPLATPIILMTSYGNERIAVEALKSGALDYVVKSPESLLDMPHLARKALDQWTVRADRIHMQEALSESETHFRLLAENASDMITRIKVTGKMFYISPACKSILGYTSEEMIGYSCFQYIHPEDMLMIKNILRQYSKNHTYTVTHRSLHKDGSYIWLETSARAILDDETQNIIEIQATSRNITERKKAEEALKNAHDQLREAYERTIEGWVRALDLRDKETEGHTQRVTEITMRVAKQLGFTEEELSHLKRGALLHDMGKIGIPDEILQKAGPLTETEWERMRQHPIHAYNMLSPIAYLNPALDIPFYHHERWDGSGYPHGLKGENIPLAARLFAIVDVWDALRSDRPYRKEMPRTEVIDYLRKNAGILFDPKLVDIFLHFVKKTTSEYELTPLPSSGMLAHCPGRPGAAKPFEPRQDRKIATVRKSLRVPPVACPDIHIPLGIIPFMSSSKIITLVIALVIGAGLGLFYGWAIAPVEYTDVTPDLLRQDYQVDFVLMTAEAYQNDFDSATAARRLALLGSEPPATFVTSTLEYASANNFTAEELRVLQALLTAMQTYQPDENPAP